MGEVRNTYKIMAYNRKEREGIGWTREHQVVKDWTGFYWFIVGPVMGVYMVAKFMEFLEF
jgi:hypothetical protein